MVSGRNAAPPESAAPDGWRPLVLANASECTVAHDGRRYALSLYRPPESEQAPAPAAGHPVIYVLDGDELFLSFAEAMRRLSRFPERTGIHPAIIVGIAPLSDGDSKARFRHYTFGPPADASSAPPGAAWGEGDALLAFLTKALPHLVSEHASIDPSGVAIYGHSLSAYFALLAAAARPDVFNTCGAISPSLWWDEAKIHDATARLATTRLFLAHGEKETTTPDPRRASRAMAPRVEALATTLRQTHPATTIATHILPNEDHGSTATVAIPTFLRFWSAASN